MPTRQEAWALLCEYTQNENLRKHALAVETCVRAYARKFAADEELWGLTALLHDFDYERWPNDAHHPTQEHPYEGSKILRERGYPEEYAVEKPPVPGAQGWAQGEGRAPASRPVGRVGGAQGH